MIRQLKLYNRENDLIDLLNNLDFFGVNPQGLGISLDNKFYGANAHFIHSQSLLVQGTFVIEILFGAQTGENYQRYNEFISFLNAPPFYLEYETDAGIWKRECVLNELTKSELNEWGVLHEQFVLDFTTPFYREKTEQIQVIPGVAGDGKIYEEQETKVSRLESYYQYDYIYDYGYYTNTTETIETTHSYQYAYIYEGCFDGLNGVYLVDNPSRYLGTSTGSPIQIEITGPAENPYWEVVQGSKILQEDGYFLDIPEDYRLVVSSLPGNQKAILVAPDGTESNVYQQQDLTKSNFVTLPVGRSQLIFHNCEQIKFTYREESVTV